MYSYEEVWNISEADIISLFPIKSMQKYIENPLSFNVLFDDDVLLKDAEAYNLAVFVRAYNEDIPDERLCRNNLQTVYPYMENVRLRDIYYT